MDLLSCRPIRLDLFIVNFVPSQRDHSSPDFFPPFGMIQHYVFILVGQCRLFFARRLRFFGAAYARQVGGPTERAI